MSDTLFTVVVTAIATLLVTLAGQYVKERLTRTTEARKQRADRAKTAANAVADDLEALRDFLEVRFEVGDIPGYAELSPLLSKLRRDALSVHDGDAYERLTFTSDALGRLGSIGQFQTASPNPRRTATELINAAQQSLRAILLDERQPDEPDTVADYRAAVRDHHEFIARHDRGGATQRGVAPQSRRRWLWWQGNTQGGLDIRRGPRA